MAGKFTIKPYQARETMFQALVGLTTAEKEDLSKCEHDITSSTLKNKKKLLEKISDFKHIHTLYKFCLASETFNDFCLKNQFLLNHNWAEVLKALDHPTEVIQSLDRNESISVFKLYTGAYFFSEYLNFEKTPVGEAKIDARTADLCLDLACEHGLFKALEARCARNQSIIKSANAKDFEVTDALVQLYTDTQRLSNLYWTVGHLHAALILADIGSHLANKDNQPEQNVGDFYLIAAAEKFLRAKELSNYKALAKDQKIIKAICGDKGLMVFEFENWESAQSFFLDRVNSDTSPHPKMILKAKQYIQDKLQATRHNIIG